MLDNQVVSSVIENFINQPVNAEVIKSFAQTLYDDFDLAFHFDDDFSSYADRQGNDLFTPQQAKMLDQILNRMWDWCAKNGVDIHELASDVQQTEFKQRGILPNDNPTIDLDEDIELTEAPSDSYDRLTKNVKVGNKYYDKYTQKIFTVDRIDNGFVCCTNVKDPSDKWNDDIISFNRSVTMEAYEYMGDESKVAKPEMELQEDGMKKVDPRYDIMNMRGRSLQNALRQMSREQMIEWLQWNDHNGTYSDQDNINEYGVPISREQAQEMMMNQILDGGEDVIEESMPPITTGYEGQVNLDNSLFEDDEIVDDEGYVNKEYRVKSNGKMFKIVSSTPPIIKYRIKDIYAPLPQVMSLDDFKKLLGSGKIEEVSLNENSDLDNWKSGKGG